MYVCVFAMHAQTNGRIWTKLGMKVPYPQGHNLGGRDPRSAHRGRTPDPKTLFLYCKKLGNIVKHVFEASGGWPVAGGGWPVAGGR